MDISEVIDVGILTKAIEVEVEHRYINITGRRSSFSVFICSEIRKVLKSSAKNDRWEYLFELFESYPVDDVAARMKAVKSLYNTLYSKEEEKTKEDYYDKRPEDYDVMYIKGVGPRIASILNKLGIYTAYDLLHYYPRNHLDYGERTRICDVVIGEKCTIYGTIQSLNIFNSKKKSNLTIISINVSDGTGMATAFWFNGRGNSYLTNRYREKFKRGSSIILSGTAKLDDFGKLTIDKPQTEVLSGDFEENEGARIVPVYSLSENLGVKTLRKAILFAADKFLHKVDEILPEDIVEKYSLHPKRKAIKEIHQPSSTENLELAKNRLIFEELFFMQLKLALMRKTYASGEGLILDVKKSGLVEKYVNSLPFNLTNAQKRAFNEILTDLRKPVPMQRLLQGDVGSGKTAVACMTLLAAVENGYQAAIMAPTEILAEQHYKNFVNILTPLGISVGLFVGKHGVKIRREIRQNLKSGLINIAVGTHALIQDDVDFANLGLVVIDEQHRFGVKQRSDLMNKGKNPEMLAMTATPIPRTLALSMHGDLDMTIIDELPAGRKPIKTVLVSPKERAKSYNLIRSEVEKGKQAYVVFPLIDESETLSAKSATKEAERLQKSVFPDLNIGLVHGKLTPVEKDRVMEEFRSGKYHILVSTTVIEVGVDVPNATVMIIENSERFGLSQLHQLRGRVGRNSDQSYCVLVADTNSQDTRVRLEVMVQTNNGFIIAEKDLEIRGPGEFMGTRQSGMPDFVLADIAKNVDILENAREAAFEFVKNSDIENYPLLKNKVRGQIEDALDLISAG